MKEQLLELIEQMNKEVEYWENIRKDIGCSDKRKNKATGHLAQLLYDLERIKAICASNGM